MLDVIGVHVLVYISMEQTQWDVPSMTYNYDEKDLAGEAQPAESHSLECALMRMKSQKEDNSLILGEDIKDVAYE